MRKLLVWLTVAGLLIGVGTTGWAVDEDLAGTLEIVHWWTAGGEKEAMDALYEVFRARYPYVSLIDASISGGAGIAARAVLISRIVGGRPPGTFQVHAGAGTIDPYARPGFLEPITFIYEQEGWVDVFPEPLLEMLRFDGEYWNVPVNIHRSNVLWYNKGIFEEHGLEAPVSMGDFFRTADKLRAAGIIPLALGETWTVVHLLETVLLGVLSPSAYTGLWDGTTSWNTASVRLALDYFDRMLNYVNEDAPALSWDEASALVVSGDAAMNIMGDWAHGYFMAQGWTPGVEYGWAPTPGSAGAFQALSDTFVLPKDAPDRDVVIAWLRTVGTREGQDAFNPIKGSISARVDADRAVYDVYQESAMDDFSQDAIVPSLQHGAAASPEWMDDFISAVGSFVAHRNVDTLHRDLIAAAEEALE